MMKKGAARGVYDVKRPSDTTNDLTESLRQANLKPRVARDTELPGEGISMMGNVALKKKREISDS